MLLLSNNAYDALKKSVQIILPGAATLYVGLSEFWNLPNAASVSGSIALVATFLGLILGVSSKQYNKTEGTPDADLVVSEVDGETYLSLGINRKSVEELVAKDSVRFAVVRNTESASNA